MTFSGYELTLTCICLVTIKAEHFSCDYWSFVYLLQRDPCSDPLSIFFFSQGSRFIEGWGSTGKPSTCGEGLLSVWRAAAWQAAGERGFQNLALLESVALGSTMPKTFGSEQGRIAGPAFMFHLIPRPEVGVFPHFSRSRQGQCQSFPRYVTRSAKYTSLLHTGHLGMVAPDPGQATGLEQIGALDSFVHF